MPIGGASGAIGPMRGGGMGRPTFHLIMQEPGGAPGEIAVMSRARGRQVLSAVSRGPRAGHPARVFQAMGYDGADR